jgi:signal transduction histidine kinase
MDPIPLSRPEATFHSGAPGSLRTVVDGVEAGPLGWSVAPKVFEKQSLVVRCVHPVEAAELDFTLFFMSGRPFSTLAEFTLSYTTDEVPSLLGNWNLLDVQRFSAEVSTLQRTEEGRLRSRRTQRIWTGNFRDDVFRVEVLLPGGRATGFRLDAFPVMVNPGQPPVVSWNEPWDYVLTEFRVSQHVRPSTNIALHRPVTASHPLFRNETGEVMKAESLTDGLPATIVHPRDESVGKDFHFQIDLGRVADLDHIGLRNRGDVGFDRFSRMLVQLYVDHPDHAAPPVWEGMERADGSHPGAGEVDLLHGCQGHGLFKGRYIRISSDNPVPLSPQLAEVEVYEKRWAEVVAAFADGKEIPVESRLDLPPGVKRLSLQLRIRQEGMPPGVLFRWRMRGDLDEWQNSRLMTLDMPCPPAGDSVFETQALHSDGQWDASIYRLPVTARMFFWETPTFRWLAGSAGLLSALGLGLFVARHRAKQQLERMRMETALANERARIAQDLHDDLGAELSSIAMLADLARHDAPQDGKAVFRMNEITYHARQTVRRLEEIVWAVNPSNDTIEGFAGYFCKFAQGYLELAGVASRFDVPDSFPGHSLPSAKRHHLFLAAKETVHNAARHGSPTEVTIRMRVNGDFLELIIEDNGCGFDDSPGLAAAHGSGNMQRRMKAVGGGFERNSIPGKGTVVKLGIPLGPKTT